MKKDGEGFVVNVTKTFIQKLSEQFGIVHISETNECQVMQLQSQMKLSAMSVFLNEISTQMFLNVRDDLAILSQNSTACGIVVYTLENNKTTERTPDFM